MAEVNDARIEALLAEMTTAEKVSMAAGSGMWFSTPVERLGIPSYKMSDGPNGVRGESRLSNVTSASFPVGTALAATWNTTLVDRVGSALAEECHAKSVQVLLGPTINMHRSPLAGRNFECYSEDPYLTGAIAKSLIRAVQRDGVACCAKHFVCNDSEFERHSINSEVDERTLREIYLYPFEVAVQEAGVWSVMSAYNRINGTYASAHPRLLGDVLKSEWGFDGAVISDWGGTYSTVEPANAGLDLEMPGPAVRMGDTLAAAVEAGDVPESALDDKVRRHLRLLMRTDKIDAPEHPPERSEDKEEHRTLLRRLGAESMVLLKNDGLLPLAAPKRIALIGPNAVQPQILGGGSSSLSPHYLIDPRQGLEEAFPNAEIEVRRGCVNHRYLPLLPAQQLRVGDTDRAGLEVSFFNNLEFEGEPALVTHPRQSLLMWFGQFNDAVAEQFSARVQAWFTPDQSGVHRFSVMSAGLSRLYVDDELVADNWTSQTPGDFLFNNGSTEVIGEIDLSQGRHVSIRVEYSRVTDARLAGLRFGMAPPTLVDDIEGARDAAANADVAVVVIGLTGEWESEGFDRVDLALPRAQVRLVQAVAEANPNTVVVVNAGCPVELGEVADAAAAVLYAWYPGQEFGNALADLLCGQVNPSGRLPTTFPRCLEDTPAFLNYPGEHGSVRYGEGQFIGYRWYDARQIEPAYPFGHGLSYTEFGYDDLRLEQGEDSVRVAFRLSNLGSVAGQEVAQVYVAECAPVVSRPPRELKGFDKVELSAGEQCEVAIDLPRRAFAFYDPDAGMFKVEPGEFEIAVGGSSRDLRLTGRLVVDL